MFGVSASAVQILPQSSIMSINTINRVDTIGTVSEISRVKDVSIKAFPCPKINDKGLTGAWWWADKISLAVAAWATAETWKSAKEEYDIGKRYYDLAKEQWDFFYNYYRPLEEQELNEIWAELPYKPEYNTAVNGHTNLVDNTFSQADKHRQALAKKYCVCNDVSQFTKIGIMQSTIHGDSDNFARRYAEQLAQERNDIRWARRIAAASRGRGLLSESTSFASKAVGMYGDYAKAMSGLASGAMEFSQYVRNRNPTEYNLGRTRINSRANVPDTAHGFNQQAYWSENQIYENVARGGLDWSLHDGQPPYIMTGFDPTGYVGTQ